MAVGSLELAKKHESDSSYYMQEEKNTELANQSVSALPKLAMNLGFCFPEFRESALLHPIVYSGKDGVNIPVGRRVMGWWDLEISEGLPATAPEIGSHKHGSELVPRTVAPDGSQALYLTEVTRR